jgi:hypothetical protein
MALRLLLLIAVALVTTVPSTYYIYNYPRFHECAWPQADAPFRLLALADPQIEGEKKLKSWRGRSLSYYVNSRTVGLVGQ